MSASFATMDEATRWVDSKTAKAGKVNRERTVYDNPYTDQSQTLKELGRQFCVIGLKGKKTQNETIGQLAKVIRQFEFLNIPLELDQITQRDINNYRIHRLEHVANATCRKDMQLISRIYKFGNREYFLGLVNPVDGVSIPPVGKPRTRIIERHELDALMIELPPIMATIIELAYETAMRRSEIVNLTPKDLSLDDRYLTVVDGKTGDRPVPLTSRAIEILRQVSSECQDGNTKLFPIMPHSVTTAFRRAREAIGLSEDLCLHQLRHTRITMVARKGFNQAQIMMVSGHKDSRSVQRYTHLNVQDVIDLLD
jgi:integrase